jgi:hypothetical protein
MNEWAAEREAKDMPHFLCAAHVQATKLSKKNVQATIASSIPHHQEQQCTPCHAMACILQ